MPNVDTNESEPQKWTGRVIGGVRVGSGMQTRFQRIPDSHLNAETVAGIRDMNLGRVKAGKPVGAPTIRFDSGQKVGPHINIDPKGRPNPNNPHIQVSEGVVKGAQTANSIIKYAGVTLTVAAVAVDAWRVGSSFKDDLYIRDHADEIIEELENAIKQLKKFLETENDSNKRQEIRKEIDHLQGVLKDVRRTKKVPVKTIKTVSSVAGGWSAGAAGGSLGAWSGAQAGAAVGTLFGPVGTVVGAPIGAIVGAIGGGVAAGMAGSAAGETLAEAGLDAIMD